VTSDEYRISAEDAVYVLETLDDAGIEVWVAGGWGVDALLEEQTREHHDLDVVIPLQQIMKAVEALHLEGFRLGQDWFPIRLEMTDDQGRVIDIHPVRMDEQGNARMEMFDGGEWVTPAAGFAGHGVIGGRRVRCHTAEQQLRDHMEYEPRELDRADMSRLAAKFGLELPEGNRYMLRTRRHRDIQ
jgi:lincosamide nucleotidyltransferase A/C/D/E